MTSVSQLADDDELVILTPSRGIEIADNTWDIIPDDSKILLLRKKRLIPDYPFISAIFYIGIAVLVFHRFGAWGLIWTAVILAILSTMVKRISASVRIALRDSVRSSGRSSRATVATPADD